MGHHENTSFTKSYADVLIRAQGCPLREGTDLKLKFEFDLDIALRLDCRDIRLGVAGDHEQARASRLIACCRMVTVAADASSEKRFVTRILLMPNKVERATVAEPSRTARVG